MTAGVGTKARRWNDGITLTFVLLGQTQTQISRNLCALSFSPARTITVIPAEAGIQELYEFCTFNNDINAKAVALLVETILLDSRFRGNDGGAQRMTARRWNDRAAWERRRGAGNDGRLLLTS